jgi:hypothetical protein
MINRVAISVNPFAPRLPLNIVVLLVVLANPLPVNISCLSR